MRRVVAATSLILLLAVTAMAEGGIARMVVADRPYERVWDAALRSVEGYPLERAVEGVVVTGWRERPAGPGEASFERVRERVTLRVEAFAERITRVTAEAEARGFRQEAWVAIPDATPIAQAALARLRAAQE